MNLSSTNLGRTTSL
uniref:Uncharacterized protein n=1 Tax=Arundo donax TaxID=35708 RepID=A0A0A9Q9K2_ARUDO